MEQKEMNATTRERTYDLIGLMPCAVKVPMEKKVSAFVQNASQAQGARLHYQILSNAVMQEDILAGIDQAQGEDDLPNIMIAPGFGRFFHQPFVERFRDKGVFSSVFTETPSKAFNDMGIIDQAGHYDIIAFNPLVLLVDKTRDPGLPTPRSWMDLCDEAFEDKVALRGSNDIDVCESILFSYYQWGGAKALQALGRASHSRLHPAEMVKIAGTHVPDAPAVFAIPFGFAKLVRPRPEIEIVWPSEGAIVNPILMATKRNATPAVKGLARFFIGPEGGQVFESNGLCSVCPGLAQAVPEDASYHWVGWDFLDSIDVDQFKEECNEVVAEVFQARKGRPPRSEVLAQRKARLSGPHHMKEEGKSPFKVTVRGEAL